MIKHDLVGKKFGKFTVLKELPERRNKRIQWLCECECGNTANVITNVLTSGERKSCGCDNSKNFNLVGKRFGQIIVLSKVDKTDTHGATVWKCVCDCGNEAIVKTGHLKSGDVKSCGKHKGTHRMTKTPEYETWIKMKARCKNKDGPDYKNYGGRGITVCKRWESFEYFIADMGKRPSAFHSIERVDNDAGYNPENCIWAEKTTQNRNQRLKSTNSSGVKGVHWSKHHGKWIARINVIDKRIHIGQFSTLEDAKEARKLAERMYWNN